VSRAVDALEELAFEKRDAIETLGFTRSAITRVSMGAPAHAVQVTPLSVVT